MLEEVPKEYSNSLTCEQRLKELNMNIKNLEEGLQRTMYGNKASKNEIYFLQAMIVRLKVTGLENKATRHTTVGARQDQNSMENA